MGLVPPDRERLQRPARTRLGLTPCCDNDAAEFVTKVGGEGGHDGLLVHDDRTLGHGRLEFLFVLFEPGLNSGFIG